MADVGNPVYVAMIRGIESVFSGLGYRLLVHSTGSDTADEVSLIESLGKRYVDGLIIAPIRDNHRLLRALAAAAAPVVVIGNLPDGALVDSVPIDFGAGLRLAAEHLVASGRQALALVNGPDDTVPGRRSGWPPSSPSVPPPAWRAGPPRSRPRTSPTRRAWRPHGPCCSGFAPMP